MSTLWVYREQRASEYQAKGVTSLLCSQTAEVLLLLFIRRQDVFDIDVTTQRE